MTAIARRSVRARIGDPVILAVADDLDGTDVASLDIDVTGAQRVIIVQDPIGTAGTLGIDVIQVSHDGGESWAADTTVMALAEDDNTGDILASAALNAAGVEPTGSAVFKSGPHNGPTLLRCDRTTNWATGSPQVRAFTVR